MYLGRVVEVAPVHELLVHELFKGPNHPYACALLDEVPRLSQRNRSFTRVPWVVLPGQSGEAYSDKLFSKNGLCGAFSD